MEEHALNEAEIQVNQIETNRTNSFLETLQLLEESRNRIEAINNSVFNRDWTQRTLARLDNFHERLNALMNDTYIANSQQQVEQLTTQFQQIQTSEVAGDQQQVPTATSSQRSDAPPVLFRPAIRPLFAPGFGYNIRPVAESAAADENNLPGSGREEKSTTVVDNEADQPAAAEETMDTADGEEVEAIVVSHGVSSSNDYAVTIQDIILAQSPTTDTVIAIPGNSILQKAKNPSSGKGQQKRVRFQEAHTIKSFSDKANEDTSNKTKPSTSSSPIRKKKETARTTTEAPAKKVKNSTGPVTTRMTTGGKPPRRTSLSSCAARMSAIPTTMASAESEMETSLLETEHDVASDAPGNSNIFMFDDEFDDTANVTVQSSEVEVTESQECDNTLMADNTLVATNTSGVAAAPVMASNLADSALMPPPAPPKARTYVAKTTWNHETPKLGNTGGTGIDPCRRLCLDQAFMAESLSHQPGGRKKKQTTSKSLLGAPAPKKTKTTRKAKKAPAMESDGRNS